MAAATGASSLVEQLLSMGFDEPAASSAVAATGGRNVDAAVAWLLGPDDVVSTRSAAAAGGRDEPVLGLPVQGVATVTHPGGEEQLCGAVFVGGSYKAVLLVNSSLKMSPGKIGAQCAHAALGLFRRLQASHAPWLDVWAGAGEKIVTLSVASDIAAVELLRTAERLGLPTFKLHDAGRTEVAAGALTVVAIGGEVGRVDSVTGHLSTL